MDKFLIKVCKLRPWEIMSLTITEHWLYYEAYKQEKEDDTWSLKIANRIVAQKEEAKLSVAARLDLEVYCWQ